MRRTKDGSIWWNSLVRYLRFRRRAYDSMDSPAIRADWNETTTTRTHRGDKEDEHPLGTPQRALGKHDMLPGCSSSLVGVTHFKLEQFTVSIKELAEWFGLEIARFLVDECLTQRKS
jgi:hypothetical protein